MSGAERLVVLLLTALLAVGSGALLWQHARGAAVLGEREAEAKVALAQRTFEVAEGGEGLDGAAGADVEDEEEGLLVHVAGAVRTPGVYRLPPGSRVVDAIEAAGGADDEGRPEALNLAARVYDGQRLYVPTTDEVEGAMQGGVSPTGTELPLSGTGLSQKVDINSATRSELERLPGIGPSLARRIVEYRSRVGRFGRLEDLLEVSGIGPKTLSGLRDYIVVP